jgi:glutamine amidotransferase-like uncharacterized protein
MQYPSMELFLLCFFLIFDAHAKPLALIYKGAGSCPQEATTGCSEAAAFAAKQAGFDYQFIGPQEIPSRALFEKARVWIQPGGRAKTQQEAMSSGLKSAIVNFVGSGGGYVGFCAGGFLAYEKFGWDTPQGSFEAKGLGLIPGKSLYYNFFDNEITEEKPAKIIKTLWNNKQRWVYWELGPYFPRPSKETPEFEIISTYEAHSKKEEASLIMTLKTKYLTGKIFITAVHPEAPADWREYYKVGDQDQLDTDLAASMIQWASQR